MFAIGNDELERNGNLGDTYKCERCGEVHEVKYGKVKNEDGTYSESKMLSYVNCGDASYLVGINGKKVR